MTYISTEHCVVLCHGFLGFDNMLGANYFKGVQEYLESKKCEVFVPRVSMVKDINYRASQLQTQIDDYLTRRNSRKERSVHLIGHSMGGLDARRLVYKNRNFKILSITTVSTPHRGSPMAAWSESLNILAKIPAAPMLALLRMCAPALEDLRPKSMERFNRDYPDAADIKYFSVGAKFDPWITHVFFYPNRFIKNYSNDPRYPDAFGPNDGMVSMESAKWGTFLEDFIQGNTSHFGVLGWELMPGNAGGANSDFDAKLLYLRLVDNVARNVEAEAE